MECPSCGKELPEGSRFCLFCGSAVRLSESPTLSRVEPASSGPPARLPPERKSSPQPPTPSAGADFEARYVPGATLAERYRIVALLGRGGMGEVYRAEDLKLGQTVALKFLPASLASNPAARERFHREVRLARQVSHPNVCRVFDIGEANGRLFITMEFVDGEDLATLLRRIGRVPPDKGLEIARQMCAGLAAAHEHGIIHRDLKPANVMLDGRGRVRVTDFGLASAESESQATEATAGTPAYMSPEQFEHREVTLQSDLYALGLVLYEVFTGKRAYDAPNLLEMVRLREKSALAFPSHLSRDIDPLVQNIIQRCLERDPAKRPPSALQVAAALPGGDPLAAALAAGETPSPGMVAAAGETGTLSPVRAWALLLSVAVALAAVVMIRPHGFLPDLLPAGKSPGALTERARQIASEHGYGESPADSAYWFDVDGDFWPYLRKIPAPARYRNLADVYPMPFQFIYRQSPQPLVSFPPGWESPTNPALFYSGELRIGLDNQGRLTHFSAIAADEDAFSTDTPVDWSSFLREAGLDPARARQVEADRYPDVVVDQQTAWKVEREGKSVQVHAGSYRNQPVFFQVRAPWARPARTEGFRRSLVGRLSSLSFVAIGGGFFLFCVFLARRNLRLGRGDSKGALRLAVFIFGVFFISRVLSSHYSLDIRWSWQWFREGIGGGAALALLIWAYYVALEPYARRSCPEVLISWTRLLEGKFRDPLVGRDVLVGILLGIGIVAARSLHHALPFWFEVRGLTPSGAYFSGGVPAFIGGLIWNLMLVLINSVGGLAVLVVIWKLTRSKSVGVAALALISILPSAGAENLWIALLFASFSAALTLVSLLRFGLLAAAFTEFARQTLLSAPVSLDFTRWYAPWGAGVVLLVLAVATYGFYTSLGGRPVLGAALEE